MHEFFTAKSPPKHYPSSANSNHTAALSNISLASVPVKKLKSLGSWLEKYHGTKQKSFPRARAAVEQV